MRLAIVLVASTFVPALSEAATVYSSEASDAVAYSDWAGGGDAKGVFNQSTAYIISDNNSVENVYWNQAVFEFPLASLAGQHDLQATLNLYTTFSQWDTTPSVSGAQLRYYGAGTGSVQYQEYLSTGQTVATFDASSSGWQTFDVSAVLQQAVDNGYSWAVFSSYVAPGQQALFGASESGIHAPSITVVPEPTILAPLLLGTLLCRRRRNGSSHASSVEDPSA